MRQSHLYQLSKWLGRWWGFILLCFSPDGVVSRGVGVGEVDEMHVCRWYKGLYWCCSCAERHWIRPSMDSTNSFIALGKTSDLLMYFRDHFTVYTSCLVDILDTYEKLRAVKDGSACMECVRQRSKLITACACVNQRYIQGCCINCDYIILVLELPRKWADWMCSKFNIIHWLSAKS